jgi:hypothetical protein
MRIPQVVVVFVVTVASTFHVPGVASACKACDPFLHCVSQNAGARACFEGPGTCALFMQCIGGGQRVPDGGEEALTTWSLFDAPVGSAPPVSDPPRRSEAGDIALGEEARASARSRSEMHSRSR